MKLLLILSVFVFSATGYSFSPDLFICEGNLNGEKILLKYSSENATGKPFLELKKDGNVDFSSLIGNSTSSAMIHWLASELKVKLGRMVTFQKLTKYLSKPIAYTSTFFIPEFNSKNNSKVGSFSTQLISGKVHYENTSKGKKQVSTEISNDVVSLKCKARDVFMDK